MTSGPFFLTLLNNHSSSSSSDKLSSKTIKSCVNSCNCWILDSGSSRHMTRINDFLQNLTPIYPYTVGSPNGYKAVATQQGNSSLGPNFNINNALLVPALQCNLISLA